MQIKIIKISPHTPVKMAIRKKKFWPRCGVKGTLVHSLGGKDNWYSRYEKQYGDFSKIKN